MRTGSVLLLSPINTKPIYITQCGMPCPIFIEKQMSEGSEDSSNTYPNIHTPCCDPHSSFLRKIDATRNGTTM